jgi:arabinose-5-phosphate isomerase
MIDFVQKARRVIDLERCEIERLSGRIDESFSRAIDLLQRCVETRGKIVVVGVGKSGHIGEKIAATLTSTGSPAVVLDSLNALHGDLGVVADGDVVLALSYSGETDELINIISALSRFDVKIISMTGNAGSFLAQNSHIHLDVSVEKEACPLNLAPTSSTTTMLVLGDALAMVLLEARGFNQEDFARFHPGGRLGRSLLLKVDQIMRKADQLAIVGERTIVREVLQEMTKRRAGAAIVARANGELAGIFTHGDFARHFQNDPALGDEQVGKFITRNPVTIRGDKLAAEVLRVLETHRIDDLVVVDEMNRPIGLVDSQDLAGLKLL